MRDFCKKAYFLLRQGLTVIDIFNEFSMRLIDTDNRKQTVTLQRMLWAIASYIFYFFIGLMGVMHDAVHMSMTHYLAAFTIIIFVQVFFLLIVRAGYSERWRESNFVFFQILFGFLVLSYFMFFVNFNVLTTLVNISLIGMLFGIFALRRRHFYILAAIPMGFYSLLIVREYLRGDIEGNIIVASAQWAITFFMLISFSFIGDYMSSLRRKIRTNRERLQIQKEELEVTHRELKSVLRQMSEKAIKDELTSLYNRHQFSETLHAQISVANHASNPLGILLMDVDNFKEVNDTHGHLAGDNILRAFNQIQENCLRKTDFIARYGGEEFVVLLPDTDYLTLIDIAERIRVFIESLEFEDIARDFKITVSIGGTHYRDRETVDELMDRVDRALYEAKDCGRNQVIFKE